MTRVTLLLLVLAVTFTGCGTGGDAAFSSNANNAASTSTGNYPSAEHADPETGKPALSLAAANSNTAMSAPTPAPNRTGAVPTKISLTKAEETYTADRKIIRNAELNLEAEDPQDAQRKITSIAELRDGFVVESQQSSSEVQARVSDIVTMTVRVPADKFNDALADIRNVSTRVVVETVKGQDVTEEFIDIEAQLKAKKALEQQFMEIMKRAGTVSDALDVQSQLADVRGDIERIEGRKRFLENQSAMSTIKVRLQTAKVFAKSSVGFGGRLSEAFASGAEVAMTFVLGLITFIVAVVPFAIIIGLPAFLIIRYVWKRQVTNCGL